MHPSVPHSGTMLIINYKYFDVIRKDFDIIGYKGKLITLDNFIKEI